MRSSCCRSWLLKPTSVRLWIFIVEQLVFWPGQNPMGTEKRLFGFSFKLKLFVADLGLALSKTSTLEIPQFGAGISTENRRTVWPGQTMRRWGSARDGDAQNRKHILPSVAEPHRRPVWPGHIVRRCLVLMPAPNCWTSTVDVFDLVKIKTAAIISIWKQTHQRFSISIEFWPGQTSIWCTNQIYKRTAVGFSITYAVRCQFHAIVLNSFQGSHRLLTRTAICLPI